MFLAPTSWTTMSLPTAFSSSGTPIRFAISVAMRTVAPKYWFVALSRPVHGSTWPMPPTSLPLVLMRLTVGLSAGGWAPPAGAADPPLGAADPPPGGDVAPPDEQAARATVT